MSSHLGSNLYSVYNINFRQWRILRTFIQGKTHHQNTSKLRTENGKKRTVTTLAGAERFWKDTPVPLHSAVTLLKPWTPKELKLPLGISCQDEERDEVPMAARGGTSCGKDITQLWQLLRQPCQTDSKLRQGRVAEGKTIPQAGRIAEWRLSFASLNRNPVAVVLKEGSTSSQCGHFDYLFLLYFSSFLTGVSRMGAGWSLLGLPKSMLQSQCYKWGHKLKLQSQSNKPGTAI